VFKWLFLPCITVIFSKRKLSSWCVFLFVLSQEHNRIDSIENITVMQASSSAYTRVHDGFVHKYEKQVLSYLVARTPEIITPDILTGLALLSSVWIAICYYMWQEYPIFLHLANIGVVLHWYGDSMDGALARYRNKARPNYGLFVDQMCDMFATAFMALGLGFSLIHPLLAISLLCLFYLITIVHLFVLKFRNQHLVSAGSFSGTEARGVLILVNILIYNFPGHETVMVINGITFIMEMILLVSIIKTCMELGAELKEKDEKALEVAKSQNNATK